jgi:hypothetical protein
MATSIVQVREIRKKFKSETEKEKAIQRANIANIGPGLTVYERYGDAQCYKELNIQSLCSF